MQPVPHVTNWHTLIVFTVLWSGVCCLTCLDYNGNTVDWYTVYKSPKISKSSDWKVKDGLAHFYLDVFSPVWAFSNHAMNDSQQAVYETLSAVYTSKDQETMYLMYNDEPSSDFLSKGDGHTKGVVAFNKTSGFWLVHSVPHFPPPKGQGYKWPDSALTNGQSFLCVSFQYRELGNITTQMLYNEPHIYDHYVAPSIMQDFPHLADVISGTGPPPEQTTSTIQVKSLSGQWFTSFAKSGNFGKDLYDGLVAPSLQEDLLVETWSNGQGKKLDSNCTAPFKVMKITKVSLPADGVSFNETKDHSKWAISVPRGLQDNHVLRFEGMWTCVGDINRMKSQFRRGGGTLCLQHSSVWKAYRDTVTDYDTCQPGTA